MPELTEIKALAGNQFERIAGAFESALLENANEDKRIAVLDGMPISAIRVHGSQRSAFKGQPLGEKQRRFVSEVLRLAHNLVSSVHLRNQIANCGQYIDSAFEIEPEPELPNVTRMMVLGEPDEKTEYFRQLRQKTNRPPK
jgi:hypothetical protein